MGYRIGSFNVKKLSYATKDDAIGDGTSVRRDYNAIGAIIRENFDVVALQEVLNENVLKLLFPSYAGWLYRWEQSRSKTEDSDEGYAFAWNANRLRLVTEPALWMQYRQDDALGKNGILRHPYYGRFTPSGTITGGPFCEFRLLNVHIRWKPAINSLLDVKTAELRRREFLVLTEQILNRVEDKRYGNNMPAYTLLLGDYNLNLQRPGNPSPYIQDFILVEDAGKQKKFITTQDKLTTLSMKRLKDSTNGTDQLVFNGYANNYDHFTYNETYFDSSGLKADTDTIDTVTLYRNGDFERHYREISDHIPIIINIELRKR